MTKEEPIRINRYLARHGIASRRNAEGLIRDGRVELNGKRVVDLATRVDPTRDTVRVDGRVLKQPERKRYVILNKPRGVITTVRDERDRKTVLDLVPFKQRLFPVGRLDAKSEGLLLLTNDGTLTHKLMHPSFKVNKIYRVRLDREFHPDHFEPLTTGLELDDGMTAPCKARYYTGELSRVEISLHEGRNRQVRRMFEALGYTVESLKRVRYGPLMLGDLPRGKWRLLTPKEVRLLKLAVNPKKTRN
jgi:pseudouridine synthase